MTETHSAAASPAPGPAPFDPAATDLPERIRDLILASLDEDKAEDTVLIDLRGKTSLADYMVVTTGRSARQVGSMADHLLRRLKDAGLRALDAEGLPQADWVLVDAGDVIVHLFRPEVRAFYAIEKMWGVALPASLAPFDGQEPEHLRE